MDKQQIQEWYINWCKKDGSPTPLTMLSDFAAEFVPNMFSVEERLPDEGQVVIIFQYNTKHPEYDYLIAGFRDGKFIDVDDLYEEEITGIYNFVTHWQKLPPSPNK